jgi:hypothetical protein
VQHPLPLSATEHVKRAAAAAGVLVVWLPGTDDPSLQLQCCNLSAALSAMEIRELSSWNWNSLYAGCPDY